MSDYNSQSTNYDKAHKSVDVITDMTEEQLEELHLQGPEQFRHYVMVPGQRIMPRRMNKKVAMMSRKNTSISAAKIQRRIARAIKIRRELALLPYGDMHKTKE